MERTYKITIRTEQDVTSLYPSERRYSASTVLGISIVFIALTMTAVLMGSLIVNQSEKFNPRNTTDLFSHEYYELTDIDIHSDNNTERYRELEKKVVHDLKDLGTDEDHPLNKVSRIYSSLAVSAFLMSLGTITAAATGLLAWKLWYIDHYIFVFFLSCVFSSAASAVAFVLLCIVLFNATYAEEHEGLYRYHLQIFSRGIAVNTVICIIISLIWSIIASKISYKGMTNTYPDDTNNSKQNNDVRVITQIKGNNVPKVIPPDVLNNFPICDKIGNHFPKKENKYLPQAESNREYSDRVNKFLSGVPDSTKVSNRSSISIIAQKNEQAQI